MIKKGKKLTVLTAYDFATARLLDEAGVDILLVGDSLGNVVLGYDNTLPVTIDEMIHHTKAVSRAKPKALVVADLPFMQSTVENAGRLVKEGGAQAVKIEITESSLPVAVQIFGSGIPVMGHVGFTPQNVLQMGYKIQRDGEKIMRLAKAAEEAGCFAIVLEMIPAPLAAELTKELSIPTIGIGAGPDCDGQVLVINDLLGLNPKPAKFVKEYATLGDTIRKAVSAFKKDVENGKFPDKNTSYF